MIYVEFIKILKIAKLKLVKLKRIFIDCFNQIYKETQLIK